MRAAGSQTPWTANVNAASYTLTNVGGIGIGLSSPTGKFQVLTGGATFFISNTNGNVGVGITSPNCQFDVFNGSITVSGTNAGIRSNCLDIKGDGTNYAVLKASFTGSGATAGYYSVYAP